MAAGEYGANLVIERSLSGVAPGQRALLEADDAVGDVRIHNRFLSDVVVLSTNVNPFTNLTAGRRPSEGTAAPPPAVATEELVTKDNGPQTDMGTGDEGDRDDGVVADDDDKNDDEVMCAQARPRCTYARMSPAASNAPRIYYSNVCRTAFPLRRSARMQPPTASQRSTRRQPKGMSPPGWAVHGQIPAAPSTQPLLELDLSQCVVPLVLPPRVTVEDLTVEEAMVGIAGSTHDDVTPFAAGPHNLGLLQEQSTTRWFATSKWSYGGSDQGEDSDIECQLSAKPSPAQRYGEDKTMRYRIHRIGELTWLLFVVYITYAAMLNMQIYLFS